MPWMFSSTWSWLPYLAGWLGFLVALLRGAGSLLTRSLPGRATCWTAFAAAALLGLGDLVYHVHLASVVDGAWSGLVPVPERLIDGTQILNRSGYAFPPVVALNAAITLFWVRAALLVGAAAVGGMSYRRALAARVEGRPVALGESALLLMGGIGLLCLGLRFVA